MKGIGYSPFAQIKSNTFRFGKKMLLQKRMLVFLLLARNYILKFPQNGDARLKKMQKPQLSASLKGPHDCVQGRGVLSDEVTGVSFFWQNTEPKEGSSPKKWKKTKWSILENIGMYHFFQATGLLVLGGSSWWKLTATCFPGCFKWFIFSVLQNCN